MKLSWQAFHNSKIENKMREYQFAEDVRYETDRMLIQMTERRLKLSLHFRWYDFWIGFYYDSVNQRLYFCPIPMCVIVFQWIRKLRRNWTQRLHIQMRTKGNADDTRPS
jgi:hypothetical protein